MNIDDLLEQYERDNPMPVGATNGKREKTRKNRLQKAMSRAIILKEESLDGLTREEAEAKLVAKSEQQVAGMSGIGFFVFKAVLTWLIGKLLSNHFGNQEESS
jgi:hypothetical protein